MNSKGTFILKCSKNNDEFNERQKKVFNQLKILEKNNRNSRDVNNKMDTEDNKKFISNISQRSYTKHFRGKESIFKKPQNPVPKNYMNKIPDFKKNPHKWTKYSLEDTEDITEESNTKSAMTFLKELAERKKIENNEEAMEELPTKIVFKKRGNAYNKSANDDVEEKVVESRDFKVVMPEYVVGQSKVKKNKKNAEIKKNISAKKGVELKLDHLLEEDE